MTIKALEFYSGIGGLHLALKRSAVDGEVVCALDWDQAAAQVYKANFPATPVRRVDISTLTASILQDISPDIDLWLLSPACQPYTVLNSHGKGEHDPRARSFLHLIQTVLPSLVRDHKSPGHLLVENVGGFEHSTTRQLLLSILHDLGYNCIEFLLTPLQFGIPNSRLRYYLLARHKSFAAMVPGQNDMIMRYIPGHGSGMPWTDPRSSTCASTSSGISSVEVKHIREFLDIEDEPGLLISKYGIPAQVLIKWGSLFDIVLPEDQRTCCFTRGYTKLVERAGSILQMNEDIDTTQAFRKYQEACSSLNPINAVQLLQPLCLRYFTPEELLRLFF
ncbi:S-adenosyl-L-methionine-dependent methyltransferase [Schizophyllum amplum]|uniref:S-adenosyl-L-methionine-dependent methyltransferase n=1 Tax=Schizophyllum amplum TaxID=97359 RepID=A0A550BXC6_9AGAR|nr:S-adenosyl-L-methionine-dependent methyltransferase [Auriculariopsis ampla]